MNKQYKRTLKNDLKASALCPNDIYSIFKTDKIISFVFTDDENKKINNLSELYQSIDTSKF